MKFCETCATEIATKDGDNLCRDCDERQAYGKKRRNGANSQRRLREQAMRDLGLVKVKGALGGTYWE